MRLFYVYAAGLLCATSVGATAGPITQDIVDFDAPRGLVVSEREATIASELVARVAEVPFKDGDRFRKGDTLLSYACGRYEAELRAARAEVDVAKLTVESNSELARHRAVGLQELEISKAKLDRARAEVEAHSVRIAQCTIAAPFNGRVVERLINPHEMPSANAPLIKIVDDENLDIELIVPSLWLAWLRVGDEFNFSIDETGDDYSAVVSRISATVDPISQTIKIRAAFKEAGIGILAGMSGSARFAQKPKTSTAARGP